MTSPSSPPRKVGVEEQLLLMDPDSGELPSVAAHVLHEHGAAADGDAPTLTRLGTLGGGARRQRQAFERSGTVAGVVSDAVARTEEATHRA